jgi:hypothetical protein
MQGFIVIAPDGVALKKRLPSIKNMIPVYSVIVAMLYGWTVVAFIWKLPSWLNYLTVGELFVILSYSFFVNLVESLLVLGLLVLICAALPQALLLNEFAIRGSVVVLCLLGSGMIFLARYVDNGQVAMTSWPIWSVVTLLILFSCLFIAQKVKSVGLAVFWLADQLSVFLYLLLPFSLLSTVAVLFRNIF